MRKFIIPTALCLALLTGACTDMSRTQQGTMSGAAMGAAAGAGISALSGGNWTTGALIGGALGGTAGYMHAR